MGELILKMYITLFPAILAGVLNMIWMKLPLFNNVNKPMDNGRKCRDDRPIFGDNKTWKGFIGYLIFGIISMVLWGFISSGTRLESYNFFYYNYENTLKYNIVVGFLLGLAYALFELPNSFIKRRIGIKEGKVANNKLRYIFIFIDQADSIFGCGLVVWMFYNIGLGVYILFILVGAFTHIIINMLLYFLNLRKNMF